MACRVQGLSLYGKGFYNMTSIITDDYTKSMLRVYSDSDKKVDSAGQKKPEFSSVLKSLESKPAPTQIQKSVSESEVSEKQLTLKSEEIDTISDEPKKLVVPSPQVVSEVFGDIPLDEEDVPSQTKITTSNTEPPKPELPTAVPQVPQVVSAIRIEPEDQQVIKSEMHEQIKAEMEKHDEIKDLIINAGKFHGVDPSLGLAIARVESSFNPKAVSKDGFKSKGVFQLLDSTGKEIHENSGISEPYKPFDPAMNTFLGIGHFRRLLDLFSKDSQLTTSVKTYGAQSADDLEKLAVAAYNAGEGNVARAQAKAVQNGKDPGSFNDIKQYLPEITRSYVDKVGSIRTEFAQYISSNEVV